MERIREEITASEVNFTVDGDEVLVRAQVRNDGPVPAQIVTLWVVQAATEKYCYFSSLDIDLLPGATWSNRGRAVFTDSSLCCTAFLQGIRGQRARPNRCVKRFIGVLAEDGLAVIAVTFGC